MKEKRTLVTTALPYANGGIHIGHLAGVYLPADIYVRYLRLKNVDKQHDVLFIGGSDEHGVPITIAAKKEGISPQDVVDKFHNLIKKSFEDFGIEFDIYSRTTSKIHYQTASDFFKKLYDDGKFIEKTSEQYYDEEAKQFLADRYITGACPHCKNPNAYGDQCEACGTSLSPLDLIEPKSTISGSTPVLRETKHWYLPLDQYENWLREYILDGHKEWKPNVYGQCKSWLLDMGLQPRAVSRDLDWGIPLPIPNAEGKVLYVWFDAPIGYISNTKELLPNDWEKWWKNEDTKLVHFIGKDNIVFHCIVFPSMLKAEGSYILPENVPANEFLNLEGNKISTSKNWAVWLHEYLVDFPDKQDVLRYVLTANAPETKDNDFTWKDFQARNNNELVAILGNFVNRVMVLTHKFFDGKVPEFSGLKNEDKILFGNIAEFRRKIEKDFFDFKFRDALKNAMEIARAGNKYLADKEPWKLHKINPKETGDILYIALQITACLSIAIEPFLPFSSKKLAKMLNFDTKDKWYSAFIDKKIVDIDREIRENLFNKDYNDKKNDDNKSISSEINVSLLSEGHQLNQPELLFEKIEDDVIERQIQKLLDTKKQNEINDFQPKELKQIIDFEDFAKIDIRVGKVLECTKVPKADKLLQFKIADGNGERTILSGIAQSYPEPEKLVGKQVCFIANFAPRKLRGIDSEGMILSAENADGKLVLIEPQREVKNGVNVG